MLLLYPEMANKTWIKWYNDGKIDKGQRFIKK